MIVILWGNYLDIVKDLWVRFYWDVDDFCEEYLDVVVVCTSILFIDVILRNFFL